jgi:hypothetical protein
VSGIAAQTYLKSQNFQLLRIEYISGGLKKDPDFHKGLLVVPLGLEPSDLCH